MKTFLLGVGAQKTATSWLSRYLREHDQCNLGFKKEYHVFDALNTSYDILRECMVRSMTSVQELTELKVARSHTQTPKIDAKLDRALKLASFYTDTENYALYFDGLHRANPNTRLVGDITPSYSLLNADNFNDIKLLMERRGFRVKIVFLMRDPVERLYSAARMVTRNKQNAGKPVTETAEKTMNRMLESPANFRRGKYDETIMALEQVFAPQDIHYGFYETLFDDDEVRKITDFLGIDFVAPDFDTKVNASPRPAELSKRSVNKARQRYDEVYRFCKDRFGTEFIESIWAQ